MAKGDDSVLKKHNKKLRKKQNSKNSVSAKIAAVIASKKRRKAGKRRICEGMCFSLPSLDDPFNDRQGKPEFKKKDPKKKTSSQKEKTTPVKGKSVPGEKGTAVGRNGANNKSEMVEVCCGEQHDNEVSDFPSKFVFWCLSAIENALRHDDAYTDGEGNSFFLNPWGLEFSKHFSTGKDLIDTGGTFATTEQIAWMVSAAADIFVRKEKQGLSLDTPFLLFLVPSEKKAGQVRTVCKPLKSVGIHTVSVHPGASLDHQIQGLKSCEPEFLISTPERLLELVSLKAIDISGISMLVIDGFDAICKAGHADAIKSIKKFISGNPSLVVFNDSFNHTSIPVVRHLLTGPICRISINNSIASLSSCIVQSVQVCTSDEDKLVKSIEVLRQFRSSQTHSSNLLYILRKDVKCHKLVKTLKSMGCSTSLDSDAATINDSVDSNRRLVTMIDLEDISTLDIGMYDVIVLPSLVPSMDTYEHILTNMARQSVNGILHGFLTKSDTEHAGPLISILEQCGQEVPETLKDLHQASNICRKIES
ncbi:putative RNA helicase [Medicago truncatula]|uniref:DEAD-box helicase family protein n=1 Tax=Medicago truncatula TaxID=3880 RepID=G7I7V7_MEDTR|nr:pre-mRNA-processing ATP-dependent RNA helicase prp5 [Medicago truncatula]AES60513.1 DEAD-box helicase family protein [Medicago truncatula]RHN78950.1 putative RNA helicase [Medicago truncatula]